MNSIRIPLADENPARREKPLEDLSHGCIDFCEFDDEQAEDGCYNHGNEEFEWPDQKESCSGVVDKQDGECVQNGQGTTGKKRDLGVEEIDSYGRADDLDKISLCSRKCQSIVYVPAQHPCR